VVEHMLFMDEVASLMPVLAILAAAAKVGDYVQPASIKPDTSGDIEVWGHADAVASITIEQRRVFAIELEAFFAKDVQRHFGAVLRPGKFPDHLQVIKVRRRGHRQ